ncbi:MAG: DNA topoisomerase I, partial [Thaumarchaeota archaeon]|nr:DNA topoisomerase I [Nitrososphaerota archaeon]
LTRGGRRYLVCSAIGHLYAVSDSFRRREVYPVFDLEWYPSHLVDKNARNIGKRILSIRKLAAEAGSFVNACDYDVEGETIGHNILRYACGGREDVALRAKFSTLTKEELVAAFDEAEAGLGAGLATAGRTRHSLDFIWGINLSRALSTSLSTAYSGYRTISMGRVQGPTLAFVVEREIEIRNFVPTPYWTVAGLFDKDGSRFEAPSSISRFARKADAEAVRDGCQGKAARVSHLSKSVFRQPPPAPFNLGDLQKEAYRSFGYTPSRTLQIAERLYLDALISYPRTSSQKLPPSIRYREILSNLGRMQEYSAPVEELLKKGGLRPREGEKFDNAHPAIYPTGELPRRALDPSESRLFDLIVRRFLVCFAEDAIRERLSVEIEVGGGEHVFRMTGRRTLRAAWMRYYSKYIGIEDRSIPSLKKGDILSVVRVDCTEKFELGPSRYNQSSLLEKMERESIGTKATRAETISTLISRGYISGDSLAATDLGISVIETMQEYCPQIVSPELTRETEEALEEIERGADDGTALIERVIDLLSKQIEALKSSESEIGRRMNDSAIQTSISQSILGACPVCKTGRLRIIRSFKTKKRFVGCTGYPTGCRASAPLPQRGTIKVAKQTCRSCGWPVVYVRAGRYPWRLCVNIDCPSKAEKKKHAVQALQKGD